MRKTILAATTTMVMLEVLAVAGCGGGNRGTGNFTIAPVTTGVGSSVPIGSLLQARDGAACALIGTGTVLVAGGRTGNAEATDTAETIDASGAVRPVLSRMSTPRAGASVIHPFRDYVLVIGGHDAKGRSLASTDYYAPFAFVAGPLLLAPRDGSAVALIGSSVFIFGGKGQKTVEVIDYVAGEPKQRILKGELGLCHEGAQAAVFGRTVIVGGGRDVDGPEAYDLDEEKTVPLAFKDAIRGDTLVETKKSVLFVGGAGETSILIAQTKEFSADLHSSITLGLGRVNGVAVPFMDGMLVLGGDDRTAPIAATDLIHSATAWEPGPSLSIPRDNAAAVALADGRVVVVGGRIATGAPCPSCEMLLPPGAPRPTSSATLDAYTQYELDHIATLMQLMDTQRALAAANDTIRQLVRQLWNVTAQRDQLTVDVANYKAQLETANAALAQSRQQLADANAQIATLNGQLADANANAAALRDRLAVANANASSAQNRIATLEGRAQNAESSLAAANNQVSTLQGQVASLQNQLATAQSQLQAAQAAAASVPQTTITQPPVVPATYASPPTRPTADVGYASQASTDPGRPVIFAVDPTTVSRGQTIRVYVTQWGNNNNVIFGGMTVRGRLSRGDYQGRPMTYVEATVPALPLSYNRTAVQVVSDGQTSDAKYVFLQ